MATSRHERGGQNNPDHHSHTLVTRRIGNNKDNDPDHHFRTLARRVIFGDDNNGGKDANKKYHQDSKNTRMLLRELKDDPYYDPVFVVIEEIQKDLLEINHPDVIAKATGFLDMVLDVTSRTVMEKKFRTIRVTPKTKKEVSTIMDQASALQEKPDVAPFLTGRYKRMVGSVLPRIKEEMERGFPTIDISFFSPPSKEDDPRERMRQINEWEKWQSNLSKLLLPDDSSVSTISKTRDNFVTALKKEPDSQYVQDGKFFTREYAGLSLEEIEKMPYPPTREDLSKITEYVAALLESEPSALTRKFVNHLFFEITFFRDERGSINYENRGLLAAINFWQEDFVWNIIFEQSPQTEEQVGRILRGVSGDIVRLFPAVNMANWCNNAAECDPVSRDNLRETIDAHPFVRQVLLHFQREHPDNKNYFIYLEEIGQEYLIRELLPALERRLERFGVKDKFKMGINLLKEELENHSFSRGHLDVIKKIFSNRLGEGLFKRLNGHSSDIQAINKIVWESLIGKAHFLPLRQGVDIVEFSEESVPGIMGIKSIAINTSGSSESPIFNISYQIKDSPIIICGVIDEKGNFRLKAPVDKEIPGLYFMLKHIALLSLHDLVVQREKQPRNKNSLPREAVIFEGIEPQRVQRDKALINDVYRRTGYTPRRVRVHAPYLPG
ncbi:MAG: hypothetical protein Q7R53_02055, partial [bacterium]|nr:hypothetical protein [bacterium]